MRAQSELRAGFQSLLGSRGLSQPDGRPLYAYRFARTDYEIIGDILRRSEPSAIQDRHGAALVVAHIAEWFRRERGGGHWDWIRPLHSLGFNYGTHAPIRYPDVEEMVHLGLRMWRRPEPTGGERLLAIVREAGFPVASVREDPRISSWLRHAVLCAERGFATSDAVGAEAWRVSDRLAQALYEPATELCKSIVDLRASLPPLEARGDPVDYLDVNRPHWRNELPFDIECEDVRSMVEQMVRMREDGAAALDVSRYLVRSGKDWVGRASLGLSGRVDLRRLPPNVAEAIHDGRRVRLFPRPPFSEELVAVAAIESYEEDGKPAHDLRTFVAKFDAPLGLEEEARMLVQSGNVAVAEFVATGGEALHDPVIALQIEQIDENDAPTSLRVLGSSPAQTNRSRLALAIREQHFAAVQFSSGFSELGRCVGSGRRIVAFSGSARFVLDGACWTWRTSADRSVDARLVLVGNLLRGVRESIFRGLPHLWIERDGHLSAPKRQSLHWRPRGRGAWRPVDGAKPFGSIDLAVIESNDLRYAIGASVVPENFNISVDRTTRELRVGGLGTRLLAVSGAKNLGIQFEGEVAIVHLGPPTGQPTIVLRLRWDAELTLTFADPSCDLRLIDASDKLLPLRSALSVEDLKGVRILATSQVSLFLELRANDAPRLCVKRSISGEVPLAAFADVISQLLGSSERLDAHVSLSALGATQPIADVKRYAEEVDPFAVSRTNAFSALAATHGLDLKGFALAHPAAGTIPLVAPAAIADMRQNLSRKLPPGPWLIYGKRRQGGKIRPRIVPATRRASSVDESVLERAIGIDNTASRELAFIQVFARPDQVSSVDQRTVIDLLTLARHEGLPISSIDALKALDRSPGLAARLLAFCDSLDERAALLDLQRDLPFLWSSTPVGDWLAAFSSRIEHARGRLATIGVDASIAYRNITSALGDIVALRPELAGHAKAVFLMNVVSGMASEGKSIDGAAYHFLQVSTGESIRSEINALISRHDDAAVPPQNLLTVRTRSVHQARWSPYDESFADVIAAPFAVADHATNRYALGAPELQRCRGAWLYDPEFFEAIVPVAIDVVLRGEGGSRKG